MSFPNRGDELASDKFGGVGSKRGVGFNLNALFLAVGDKTLWIIAHADMELELIDSWHHNFTSLVS